MGQEEQNKIQNLENRILGLERKGIIDHQHNGFDTTKVDIQDLNLNSNGSIYLDTNTTITVGVVDTWYEIDSNFSKNIVQNSLFAGDHYLRVGQTGRYQILISASIQTGTAAQEVALSVMKNSAVIEASRENGTISEIDKSVNIATNIQQNLTHGDQISSAVLNHADATDIVAEKVNISLFRIG